ncbi:GntR family transcriptional regulator [Oryzobacter telluris]|uniref:GntR family transcriptional regulator n=1 Tax=Oryzobacter telluris TaxID=3149179 RepID=UPI00370D1B75
MARFVIAMDGLLRVDPTSSEAPFEQVRRQLAEAVGDGRLAAGAKLPTIRALAEELGLAVNTVARAYRELEAAGLVLTRRRLGTVVSPDGASAATAEGGGGAPAGGPDPALRLAAADYARAARASGLPETEAVALVRDAFRRLG